MNSNLILSNIISILLFELMNKDERNLSLQERELLVLSPEQLITEYNARTQSHLYPLPHLE